MPEGDVGLLITHCLTDDINGFFEPWSEYADWESRLTSSLDEGSCLRIVVRSWTWETSKATGESEGRRGSRRVEGNHTNKGTVLTRPKFSTYLRQALYTV